MSATEGAVGYAALWVADLAHAAAFYADALGWSYTEVADQYRMVDDPTLPRSIVALAALPAGVWDEWPRHSTLFLSHAVDDLPGAVERVRAAGGRVHAAGGGADCVDDQGMPFSLHTADGAAPGTATAPGRLAYLTFEVADTARARAFLGAVFGWHFAPGNVEDGWQIDGLTPMGGLHGGHDQATVVPMYAVDRLEAAVAAVCAAGGSATDPERRSFGTMSSCADDQGSRFHLGELSQD